MQANFRSSYVVVVVVVVVDVDVVVDGVIFGGISASLRWNVTGQKITKRRFFLFSPSACLLQQRLALKLFSNKLMSD